MRPLCATNKTRCIVSEFIEDDEIDPNSLIGMLINKRKMLNKNENPETVKASYMESLQNLNHRSSHTKGNKYVISKKKELKSLIENIENKLQIK